MRVFDAKLKLQSQLRLMRSENNTIGMVPTMGALHEGHLALVRQALSENDVVVVSIFINPTQFNNPEDLNKYPRSMEQDSKLLSELSEELLIFAPGIREMYPESVESVSYNFDGIEEVMEGKHRPGHFDGVATIVEALLRAVSPDRAYFGEKDYQQLQIVRKLVSQKQLPIEIMGCPIVREPSGLAMSSRNERLPKRLRKEASFIYKTLQAAKVKFGTESAIEVSDWVDNEFNIHPDLELEYFEIADAETLRPIRRKQKENKYRAFIAVYAEGIRLIDNIALN
ncbi:pantoate--beta-alanine ligase [Poritiphilus flavus]|uniref:Pantothenate synthetase n=1 Tax=Poritiphilus flavus TaxID=2697053 RepID=A0A6L9ED33_9FLAO|nr:pantoate--beta-alanine ligase [Poritiphilus flavus]NAS12596.1 pantoate--beta-alanine ligase [Poritiphilus flavus]